MTAIHERTARFLNPIRRRRYEIVTPEGVTLTVDLAEPGERLTALTLDLLFCAFSTLVILLVVSLAFTQEIGGMVAASMIGLVAFLVWNLYFVYFELAWQGMTPGKRIVGIRVIDRRGGPLPPGAVIARNLTRNLEVILPAEALLGVRGSGHALLESLSIALWLLLLAALPLFNRNRMRGGDFIAGTVVISLPKRRLLADLVRDRASYLFADAQLSNYGAFELQILEELLRRPDGAETARLRRDVYDRICRKIGWPDRVPHPDIVEFLGQFYTAQRAFLEREQLYGRRRDDKNFAKG
jgi:uncharacterized RDD family membrane protein YckC